MNEYSIIDTRPIYYNLKFHIVLSFIFHTREKVKEIQNYFKRNNIYCIVGCFQCRPHTMYKHTPTNYIQYYNYTNTIIYAYAITIIIIGLLSEMVESWERWPVSPT